MNSARGKFTESKATKCLQDSLFYFGHGQKYLGYRITDSLQLEDGTWKKIGSDHPQVWKVEKHPQWGWSPVLKHLQGSYRGVCRGVGETHVPFITSDLDRHNGDILATDHIKAVLRTRKLLIQKFGQYVWLAEVNPNNGSVKFFGFNRTRTPIPIERAKEVAEQIHDDLIEVGIGKREIFPHNGPQVFLPMRPDKTTVIDTGVLEKCVRQRNKKHDPNNPDSYIPNKKEKFETYSLLAFLGWLRRGSNCDEFQLYKVLKEACANLPDVPSTNAALVFSADAEKMPSPKAETDITLLAAPVGGTSLNDIRNNPDAFLKDHQFVMWQARRLRRVPTVDEALAADKKNNIYNGRWENGLSERRRRYKKAIPYVAQTFDQEKCGAKSQRPELDEKVKKWRGKAHCFTKTIRASIRTASRIDEYGNVSEGIERTVTVQRDHVLQLAGIMDHVSEHSRSGHDISRDSIQGWWNELEELPAWKKDNKKDNYYYLACRNVLVRMGWFRIDHQYHRGQAKKCYKVSPDLVGSVWSYPVRKEYKTALHNGYVSFDTSKNSAMCRFDLLLSSRPPP